MKHCLAIVAATLLAAHTGAWATPYWIAWEGDDWPENQGWTHHASNYFGGPLATRTLEGGWMTIDGTASHGITDFCDMDRPGALDPDPGEDFIMQWRLRIDEIAVTPRDPEAGVFSDDGWVVGLEYTIDSVQSVFESYATVYFAPHVAHSFELRSSDMRTYRLYIDDKLAREGQFVRVLRYSHVGWGDAVVGAASKSRWDYFRFGAVVPEPSAFLSVVAVYLAAGTRVSRWQPGKRQSQKGVSS